MADFMNLLLLFLGFNKPKPPSWEWTDRPFNNTGKAVEDGDRIRLKMHHVQEDPNDTRIDLFENDKWWWTYVGYEERDGGEWAKAYEGYDESPYMGTVFTVKKNENGRLDLVADINGSAKILRNNGDFLSYYSNDGKDNHSTAWVATKHGYQLFFKSRPQDEVKSFKNLNVKGEGQDVFFFLIREQDGNIKSSGKSII